MTIKVGLLRPEVTNVDDLFGLSDPAEGDVRMIENKGFPPLKLGMLSRRTVRRNYAKGISLAKEQVAELGPADLRCVLQDGLEHSFQFARRT
jgi:hypothetical protein